MGSEQSPVTSQPRRRPPAWFFIVVVALVVAGIAAPAGVTWFIHQQQSTVPTDTTGNRPDSAPFDTLPSDSATRSR